MIDSEDQATANRVDLRAALASRVSLPVFIGRGNIFLKGAMNLAGRLREVLALRAKLSIIYAAVWAFGGAANSTERRRHFDSDLRDAVEKHFMQAEEGEDLPDLPIPVDCSLFECVLGLEHCVLKPAVEVDQHTLSVLTVPGIPKKFENLNLYATLRAGSTAERTVFGVLDRLIFRTPSTRSVDAAMRILLDTGANIVLFGDKGAGKSMLVTDILNDLKVNLPTPRRMREQVNENLVDIVNGAKKSEGIFAALEILKYILGKFSHTELKDDKIAEFHQLWNSAGEGLKVSIMFQYSIFFCFFMTEICYVFIFPSILHIK